MWRPTGLQYSIGTRSRTPAASDVVWVARVHVIYREDKRGYQLPWRNSIDSPCIASWKA